MSSLLEEIGMQEINVHFLSSEQKVLLSLVLLFDDDDDDITMVSCSRYCTRDVHYLRRVQTRWTKGLLFSKLAGTRSTSERFDTWMGSLETSRQDVLR